MRIRQTVDNPDSQFVAMPQTITPAGIELNPQTEPIQDPNPHMEKTSFNEPLGNNTKIDNTSDSY